MSENVPNPELDVRYGDGGVTPTPWATVEQALSGAELYWLTSVRSSGGPHMTPLIGVYADGALHFCTGGEEQKARNIAGNPAVLMSTGANTLHAGLDVAVEGTATPVTDDVAADRPGHSVGGQVRRRVALRRRQRAAFQHSGGRAEVFHVEPTRAYAFGKDPYSHTRYRFD